MECTFNYIEIRRKLMRIIAIANQKGGCGKTTTAINLAAALVATGKRILLVDCDPQSHATMGLNKNPSGLEKSMYNVITPQEDECLPLEDIIVSVKDNFDLAPSSVILSAVEQELSGLDGREDRLLKALQPVKTSYDYIMIDCPPSIGLLCFNALRACEEIIIPIDMSLFSLRGVAKLMELVVLLKDKLDHDIQSRALITMYDYRTRYSRRVLEKVKDEFGENVFETVIRYNIRLRETVDYGLPISDYDKHAIGSKDYEDLAEEVMRARTVAFSQQKSPAVQVAHDIIQKTGNYIDEVVNAPAQETPEVDTDESDTDSFSSSYGRMIQTIAADPAPVTADDDGDEKLFLAGSDQDT
jgi:chromosome partitioning protein